MLIKDNIDVQMNIPNLQFNTDIFGLYDPMFVKSVLPNMHDKAVNDLLFKKRLCFVAFSAMISFFVFLAPLWFLSTFILFMK